MDVPSEPDQKATSREPRLSATNAPLSAGDAGRGDEKAPAVDSAGQSQATNYARLAAVVRLVACFAAMHAAFFSQVSGPHVLRVPYALIILAFAGYAAVLYWRAVSMDAPGEGEAVYWVDSLIYLTITGLTGGPSSPYSVFLSFPLLFASLRWGFASGLWMAAFSGSALWVMGILKAGLGASWLAPDIVFPPLALLLLGYLMATWARSDRALNRRLASVKDFNSLFSPRLTFEQIVDRAARSMAQTYPVDTFVLVQVDAGAVPKVHRGNGSSAMYRVSADVAVEIANALSRIDIDPAVLYLGRRGPLPAEIACVEPDTEKREKLANAAEGIAARFSCADFCMIRFELQQGARALLFIGSSRPGLNPEDLRYFRQVGEQLSPVLDNVNLVDRLVHEVTDFERRRIARDIHDSTIQPYIGLKFGLEALARKSADGKPLAKEIGELVELANAEIVNLRRFVRELRDGEEGGNADLVPALRRHALRYGKIYGIKVVLESAEGLRVGDHLASEAFHMVIEALSNIRRHTTAAVANVRLSCDDRSFKLQIANRREEGSPAVIFTPRSIAERARTLGGTCTVEAKPGEDTVVTVELPMQARGDEP